MGFSLYEYLQFPFYPPLRKREAESGPIGHYRPFLNCGTFSKPALEVSGPGAGTQPSERVTQILPIGIRTLASMQFFERARKVRQ